MPLPLSSSCINDPPILPSIKSLCSPRITLFSTPSRTNHAESLLENKWLTHALLQLENRHLKFEASASYKSVTIENIQRLSLPARNKHLAWRTLIRSLLSWSCSKLHYFVRVIYIFLYFLHQCNFLRSVFLFLRPLIWLSPFLTPN